MNPSTLKYIRKTHGLTLQQIADLVSLSKQAVSKWESGKVNNISEDKLMILEQVFGKEIVALIHEELTDELKEKIEGCRKQRNIPCYKQVNSNRYIVQEQQQEIQNSILEKIRNNQSDLRGESLIQYYFDQITEKDPNRELIEKLIHKNTSSKYQIDIVLQILDRVSDKEPIDYSQMSEEQIQLHTLLKMALELARK